MTFAMPSNSLAAVTLAEVRSLPAVEHAASGALTLCWRRVAGSRS
jgi:hypothetical protein